jgi:hypothetical protein
MRGFMRGGTFVCVGDEVLDDHREEAVPDAASKTTIGTA